MGLSAVAQGLKTQNRLIYGDPCFEPDWVAYKDSCREVTGNSGPFLLASKVFSDFGISSVNAPPPNDWTCCCPLDLFTQDPFTIIKMSVDAKLLDEEYWEVYCDPFGKARYIKILDGSSQSGDAATLPTIHHCVRSAKISPLVDLVVVRSADPPPFRKCGDELNIIPGGQSLRQTGDQLFSDNYPVSAVKFSWGDVTGYSQNQPDLTCSFGAFRQYGSLVYPEYDRKQVYNDGIRDLWELPGFSTVLHWLVDIEYNMPREALRHYSIQFTKSTEIPTELVLASPGANDEILFPPSCDLIGSVSDADNCTPFTDEQSREAYYTASQAWSLSAQANTFKPPKPRYVSYFRLTPSFGFSESNRWLYIGADECMDTNQAENAYEATSAIFVNGCPLDGWKWLKGDTPMWEWVTLMDFGRQRELQTIELNKDDAWVEVPLEAAIFTKPEYILRSKLPDSLTQWTRVWKDSDYTRWENPFAMYHLQTISYRFQGYDSYSTCGYYQYPGIFYGTQEGLYTLGWPFYAKVQIARPGIMIKGAGRDAELLLNSIRLSARPVYQIDVPGAIGACGRDYCGWVDPYADLRDAKYCTVEPDVPTEMEKLQAAMNGVTLEMTLPFFFPELDASTPTKADFEAASEKCLSIARNLYTYFDSYRDVPDKHYTLVCSPPASQNEVPFLGQTVTLGNAERVINSISYQYQDGASFLVNIEVGPANISVGGAGSITPFRTETVGVTGRIVSEQSGALFGVYIPGIGEIKAWNLDKYPWDTGDRVQVTLYNNPITG